MDYLDVNELYRLLVDFDPALSIEKPESDVLIIRINEYLTLSATEANEMLEINRGVTHMHMGTEEMARIIIDILNGEYVFVERRSIFAKHTTVDFLTKFEIYKKSKYEKIKDQYLGKKRVRIYSGNVIIQRAD